MSFMNSFGFLPLGDTPSPGNSQNTIPFITPSPVSMGNIMENVHQAPRAKVTYFLVKAHFKLDSVETFAGR